MKEKEKAKKYSRTLSCAFFYTIIAFLLKIEYNSLILKTIRIIAGRVGDSYGRLYNREYNSEYRNA